MYGWDGLTDESNVNDFLVLQRLRRERIWHDLNALSEQTTEVFGRWDVTLAVERECPSQPFVDLKCLLHVVRVSRLVSTSVEKLFNLFP